MPRLETTAPAAAPVQSLVRESRRRLLHAKYGRQGSATPRPGGGPTTAAAGATTTPRAAPVLDALASDDGSLGPAFRELDDHSAMFREMRKELRGFEAREAELREKEAASDGLHKDAWQLVFFPSLRSMLRECTHVFDATQRQRLVERVYRWFKDKHSQAASRSMAARRPATASAKGPRPGSASRGDRVVQQQQGARQAAPHGRPKAAGARPVSAPAGRYGVGAHMGYDANVRQLPAEYNGPAMVAFEGRPDAALSTYEPPPRPTQSSVRSGLAASKVFRETPAAAPAIRLAPSYLTNESAAARPAPSVSEVDRAASQVNAWRARAIQDAAIEEQIQSQVRSWQIQAARAEEERVRRAQSNRPGSASAVAQQRPYTSHVRSALPAYRLSARVRPVSSNPRLQSWSLGDGDEDDEEDDAETMDTISDVSSGILDDEYQEMRAENEPAGAITDEDGGDDEDEVIDASPIDPNGPIADSDPYGIHRDAVAEEERAEAEAEARENRAEARLANVPRQTTWATPPREAWSHRPLPQRPQSAQEGRGAFRAAAQSEYERIKIALDRSGIRVADGALEQAILIPSDRPTGSCTALLPRPGAGLLSNPDPPKPKKKKKKLKKKSKGAATKKAGGAKKKTGRKAATTAKKGGERAPSSKLDALWPGDV